MKQTGKATQPTTDSDRALLKRLRERVESCPAIIAEEKQALPQGHLRLVSAINEIRTGSQNSTAYQDTNTLRTLTDKHLSVSTLTVINDQATLSEDDIDSFLQLIR